MRGSITIKLRNAAFYIYAALITITLLLIGLFRTMVAIKRYRSNGSKSIAFFHPYCNSGGGGERVLWKMIEAILTSNDPTFCKYFIVIYTGDIGIPEETILSNVQEKFGISLLPTHRKRLKFIYIHSRSLLEAKWYPVFTMMGQSLGSIAVCIECIYKFIPDVYCDTTGAAFTYPLVSIFTGAVVIAYLHYPTISSDMLQAVMAMRPQYNNSHRIASNRSISLIKQLYYRVFKVFYGYSGSYALKTMVNSSWTESHIRSIWHFNDNKHRRILRKVYPPCNTSILVKIPINNQRESIILSIGQFRPEKDHLLQLMAMHELLRKDKDRRFKDVKLVMLGSVRNEDDEQIVSMLSDRINQLDLQRNVEIVVNCSYIGLLQWLGKASIGIHTMWNEHFGISIVEMMAAGLIVVAHNSGGPMMDIVIPYKSNQTGYLASTPDEYASAIVSIFSLTPLEDRDMREAARNSSQRFSDEIFAKAVLETINDA